MIMNGHLSVELRLVLNAIYIKTIFKDSDFTKTRNALKAKQTQLKRHGLENRPKATTALVDDEIEILLDKKLFG